MTISNSKSNSNPNNTLNPETMSEAEATELIRTLFNTLKSIQKTLTWLRDSMDAFYAYTLNPSPTAAKVLDRFLSSDSSAE